MATEEPSDQLLAPQKTNSNDLSKTLNLSACSTVDEVVALGLGRLSALYDNDLSPMLSPIWTECLSNIEPARLAMLFKNLEKTFVPTMACPFPVPAHIINLLSEEKTVERSRAGELAWQEALYKIKTQFHPQLGWRGEKLAAPVLTAVRSAGGISHIWQADEARLIWAKKEFVEAYLRDLP